MSTAFPLQLGRRHVQPSDRRRRDTEGGGRQGTAAAARPAGRRRSARPRARPTDGWSRSAGTPTLVSDVLTRLHGHRSTNTGLVSCRIWPIRSPANCSIHTGQRPSPNGGPIHPPVNSDQRGGLVETVKAAGGQAQVFYSTTKPGFTRGQHWHRRKVERFMVLRGQAEIRLRKLFTNEVVTSRSPGSGRRSSTCPPCGSTRSPTPDPMSWSRCSMRMRSSTRSDPTPTPRRSES